VKEATIGLVNQAAMKPTGLLKPTPSHYLADALYEEAEEMVRKHPVASLQLRWVPGHSKIRGIDAADAETKDQPKTTAA
jgi:ribonuclease HI